MNKSLLLDIDGVLVREKALLKHVKDNCVRYVQNKLPEAKDPRDVNKILYLAHGHTAIGLKKSFGIDTSDFNEKVYDHSLIDHLAEVIYAPEFQQEAEEIHGLIRNGWNVTLFTNSPIEWAVPIAYAISDEICVHSPDGTWHKPEAAGYVSFPKDRHYIFVDDSLKNLGTARWLPNWSPVYFNEGPVDHKLWCPTVSSVWEICLFANSHTAPGK